MSHAKRNWNVMLEENHIFQGYKQIERKSSTEIISVQVKCSLKFVRYVF